MTGYSGSISCIGLKGANVCTWVAEGPQEGGFAACRITEPRIGRHSAIGTRVADVTNQSCEFEGSLSWGSQPRIGRHSCQMRCTLRPRISKAAF
jgi:hypothetical protein